MIYLKSLVAGIATVVMAALLSAFFMTLYLYASKPNANEAIGLDPISFAKTSLAWLIIVVIFMAGFLWKFRHIKA